MNAPLIPVADDIYQVPIPLPFALRIVNCYLLRDESGWAILDTGINTPEGRAAWKAAWAALGIKPRQIQRIFLTHVHPDHFGLAGWIQAQTIADGGHAEVYASPREIRQAQLIWEQESEHDFAEYLMQHGMPEDMARAVNAGLDDTRAMTLPHADALHPLMTGSLLEVGTRRFRLLLAEGHADGQLLFYDERDALLLSGDHVLMGITPNIGIWTETDPHPLRRYLQSLAALRDLPVRLALPGHKALIHDWSGRIRELEQHHEERLHLTLEAVRSGRTDAYRVALVIFQHMRFTPHEWRFALAEALAHLDELVLRGQLVQQGERFTLA
jgi:glyoxylase-like metal-dependent hydrolase (beta-lactamase superfamily II)